MVLAYDYHNHSFAPYHKPAIKPFACKMLMKLIGRTASSDTWVISNLKKCQSKHHEIYRKSKSPFVFFIFIESRCAASLTPLKNIKLCPTATDAQLPKTPYPDTRFQDPEDNRSHRHIIRHNKLLQMNLDVSGIHSKCRLKWIDLELTIIHDQLVSLRIIYMIMILHKGANWMFTYFK